MPGEWRSAMSLQTQHDPKNEAEITYWNSAGGRRWVERQQSQDIILSPILQATLERAQLRQGRRGVDCGCGAGASSMALAERAGSPGQGWVLTFQSRCWRAPLVMWTRWKQEAAATLIKLWATVPRPVTAEHFIAIDLFIAVLLAGYLFD